MLQATRLDDRIARHQAEVLGFLRRRAPADAEELAQEVWLRVTAAAPDCPDDASFRAYAFAVARRLLIDHHRKPARRVHLVALEDGAMPAQDPDAESALGARQTARVVEDALAAMAVEQAEVFRWRTFEHLPFKEIASRQGVPLNTALGRMHRAMVHMSRALAARGLLPPEEER